MLSINTATKNIYCSDAYTGTFTCVIGSTTYTSTDIKSGSIEITEALSSNDSIQFSSTEKACLKITLGNLNHSISDLNGQQLVLTHVVNNESIPLGVYTIATSKNNGVNFVDIEAYDNLELLDRDVSDWWNNTVTLTMTVRNMLISLLTYCGATYNIPSSFTNSSYLINKTAVFEGVTGLEILGYLQEISACFFKPNRNGTFVRITLPTGTWSSSTPAHLYTVGETVKDLKIADYVTDAITKVQVRGTANDVGIIVGTGVNSYIIESNLLLANIEDNSTNRTMLTNILNVVNKIQYRPFSGTFRGLPFIEVGDVIKVTTTSDLIGYGVLTKRTLFNAGLRRDNIDIKGSQQQQAVTRTNRSITVLNNKIHEVVNTVDEFRSTITEQVTDLAGDVESNTSSIEQHSNQITLVTQKVNSKADATGWGIQYRLSSSDTNWNVAEILYPGSAIYPSDYLFPRAMPSTSDLTWSNTMPHQLAGWYLWAKYEVQDTDTDGNVTTETAYKCIRQIADVYSEISQARAEIKINSDSIQSTVQQITEVETNLTNVITTNQTQINQRANQIELTASETIQKVDVLGNSVEEIREATAFLDKTGLHVQDSTNPSTQTDIDGAGLEVIDRSTEEALLTANINGVDAKRLTSKDSITLDGQHLFAKAMEYYSADHQLWGIGHYLSAKE